MISSETITEQTSHSKIVSVESLLEQIKEEDFLSETITEISDSLLKQVQRMKWNDKRNFKYIFSPHFIGVSILYSLRDKNIYIKMFKNELTSRIIVNSNLKGQLTSNTNIFKEKPYLTYYREGAILLETVREWEWIEFERELIEWVDSQRKFGFLFKTKQIQTEIKNRLLNIFKDKILDFSKNFTLEMLQGKSQLEFEADLLIPVDYSAFSQKELLFEFLNFILYNEKMSGISISSFIRCTNQVFKNCNTKFNLRDVSFSGNTQLNEIHYFLLMIQQLSTSETNSGIDYSSLTISERVDLMKMMVEIGTHLKLWSSNVYDFDALLRIFVAFGGQKFLLELMNDFLNPSEDELKIFLTNCLLNEDGGYITVFEMFCQNMEGDTILSFYLAEHLEEKDKLSVSLFALEGEGNVFTQIQNEMKEYSKSLSETNLSETMKSIYSMSNKVEFKEVFSNIEKYICLIAKYNKNHFELDISNGLIADDIKNYLSVGHLLLNLFTEMSRDFSLAVTASEEDYHILQTEFSENDNIMIYERK